MMHSTTNRDSHSLRWKTLVGAALLLCGASGCGETVEPMGDGRLEVGWEVSPRGCQEAGVETVRVDLAYEQGTRTETFRCTKGEAVVGNLRPANYDVSIVGLDDEGDATFGAGPDRVTVHGGEKTSGPSLRLTARPASLSVLWRFANGLVCGANQVGDIELTLYDEDDFRVRGKTVGCSKGRVHLGEIPPGDYLVELIGEGDEATFVGYSEVETNRGKEAGTEVVLEYRDK